MLLVIEMDDTDYLFDIIQHKYTLPAHFKLYFIFVYILCTCFVDIVVVDVMVDVCIVATI